MHEEIPNQLEHWGDEIVDDEDNHDFANYSSCVANEKLEKEEMNIEVKEAEDVPIEFHEQGLFDWKSNRSVEVRVTDTVVEMVRARKNDDEEPPYDPDDLENYFSFRVHHGREFDGKMENYIGGTISFVDYMGMDELSLLDMDDIAIQLYDDEEQPAGIGGVNIGPASASVEVGSGGVNSGPVGVDIGPASAGVEVGFGGVNSGPVGVDIGPASAGVEVGSGSVNIGPASVEIRLGGGGVEIGSASVVGNIGDELNVESIENEEVVESDIDLGSDDLRSLDGFDGEEDDGGPPRKFIKTNFHEFNPRYDLQDPIFRVGMEFGSADLFRKAIRAHAVKHRRVVKFKKNDPNRVRAVCMGEEQVCKFKMITEKYVGQWRVNPNWNFAGLSQQLRTNTNVDASIWQYYRARKAARQMIQGSVKEQYSKLWEYGAEIRRMKPGSTVMIKCTEGHGDGNPRFERLYMCLAALKKGWKEGCRPILGLDGYFIKGFHTGQLLTAIGVDPNNQMYPVAYALVESECKDTLSWFLKHLTDDLGLNNSYGIVWITDKQKGLIDVIKE
ncbi:hypothetical protein Q3G72_004098 [Acer saccharum]|nr:hypothetical protein Q3G72_004098 [Acer saccharum]